MQRGEGKECSETRKKTKKEEHLAAPTLNTSLSEQFDLNLSHPHIGIVVPNLMNFLRFCDVFRLSRISKHFQILLKHTVVYPRILPVLPCHYCGVVTAKNKNEEQLTQPPFPLEKCNCYGGLTTDSCFAAIGWKNVKFGLLTTTQLANMLILKEEEEKQGEDEEKAKKEKEEEDNNTKKIKKQESLLPSFKKFSEQLKKLNKVNIRASSSNLLPPPPPVNRFMHLFSSSSAAAGGSAKCDLFSNITDLRIDMRVGWEPCAEMFPNLTNLSINNNTKEAAEIELGEFDHLKKVTITDFYNMCDERLQIVSLPESVIFLKVAHLQKSPVFLESCCANIEELTCAYSSSGNEDMLLLLSKTSWPKLRTLQVLMFAQAVAFDAPSLTSLTISFLGTFDSKNMRFKHSLQCLKLKNVNLGPDWGRVFGLFPNLTTLDVECQDFYFECLLGTPNLTSLNVIASNRYADIEQMEHFLLPLALKLEVFWLGRTRKAMSFLSEIPLLKSIRKLQNLRQICLINMCIKDFTAAFASSSPEKEEDEKENKDEGKDENDVNEKETQCNTNNNENNICCSSSSWFSFPRLNSVEIQQSDLFLNWEGQKSFLFCSSIEYLTLGNIAAFIPNYWSLYDAHCIPNFYTPSFPTNTFLQCLSTMPNLKHLLLDESWEATKTEIAFEKLLPVAVFLQKYVPELCVIEFCDFSCFF